MNDTLGRMPRTARRFLAMLVLIGAGTLAACEDDPVDVGHQEEDVAGFELRTLLAGGGSTTLYRYTDPENPDTLQLADDATLDVEIVWLDDHGEVVSLEADEHSWDITESSPAIHFTPSSSDPWRGTITTQNLLAGVTVLGTLQVRLFHGEEQEFGTVGIVTEVSGT